MSIVPLHVHIRGGQVLPFLIGTYRVVLRVILVEGRRLIVVRSTACPDSNITVTHEHPPSAGDGLLEQGIRLKRHMLFSEYLEHT